ncbi:tetratricopeptide repeat protein [Enterobacter mori]|uniref:tetratricopeptide repeat protein n=1 Tax=Enterobacter mori TaxID=539813 RepID=UPI003891D8B8
MSDKEKHIFTLKQLVNDEVNHIDRIVCYLDELRNTSSCVLKGIYSTVYEFYIKDQLDNAEVLFKALCIYDIENADFVKGYAIVNHLKKNYQRAYDLYRVSLIFDKEDDYRTFFFMAQCQLSLNNREMGLSCLKIIINKSNSKVIRELATHYITLLERSPPSLK